MDFTFRDCSGLTSVSIPNSVTSIGDYAFSGCSNLTAVSIPNSVTSIGESAFRDCSSLTEVIIPNYVTTINDDTFRGCSGLTSVTIPNSVTSIWYNAFDGANLFEIVIPASVNKIADLAFARNMNLKKVVSLNTTPPEIDIDTFDYEVVDIATLHVQKDYLDYYLLDSVWKQFANIADDILYLQEIPAAIYGDDEIDLMQYAPEGVTFKYETSDDDVVKINGTKMQIVGAGTATVNAHLVEEDAPMEMMGQTRQFTVKQGDLTVTVSDIVIEEGQPLPDFTMIAEGLQYEDTLDDIETLPVPQCEVDENTTPGEYPVTFTEGRDRNYRITTVTAKVTVTKGSGINIITSVDDDNAEVELYLLNGVLVYKGPKADVQLTNGIYIMRQGNKINKVIIK